MTPEMKKAWQRAVGQFDQRLQHGHRYPGWVTDYVAFMFEAGASWEREECAKSLLAQDKHYREKGNVDAASVCFAQAIAIRARGKK